MKKKKPGKFTSQFPLLVARCEELEIEIASFQAFDNNVIVHRLDPLEQSAGGIFVPTAHQSPNIKGVLIAAGPRAMDTLVSNGITLGHVVIFSRFAGWETNDTTPVAQKDNRILMLKDRDIIGSDDLREVLESGEASYVLEGGRHVLALSAAGRRLLGLPGNSRRQKLLAVAADPGATPAERETAKRLAGGTK